MRNKNCIEKIERKILPEPSILSKNYTRKALFGVGLLADVKKKNNSTFLT